MIAEVLLAIGFLISVLVVGFTIEYGKPTKAKIKEFLKSFF